MNGDGDGQEIHADAARYARRICGDARCCAGGGATKAEAEIKAVATTSILGDLVRNVGGDRVEVTTLIGPNGDAHVYSPTPGDAKKLADATVVFINGLGLEGWMPRLVKASGTKAASFAVSKGVAPLKGTDAREGGRMATDPHAWQSVADAKLYVANIRDGLRAVDPAGAAGYEANAADYLRKLDALEKQIEAAIDRIPADRREVIVNHNSFGYFSAAYGMTFVSPEGVSTDAEPSAKDVARIITLIRTRRIPAVFLENIADPRLIEQIARETGAAIGGRLYSDALSEPNGPAASYIDLMRHNVEEFSKALIGRQGGTAAIPGHAAAARPERSLISD
jgi:zinc/manganese transport system substrate-binding protein